jgi:hypothetical protein
VTWGFSLLVGAGELFLKLTFFRLFPALSQGLMSRGQKIEVGESSAGPAQENAEILKKVID